jgi:hypothetical protein
VARRKPGPKKGTITAVTTTKSKLVVLEALQGVDLGQLVKRTWQGLTVACHHHSYELQPSAAEVRDLVEQVRGLDASGPTM